MGPTGAFWIPFASCIRLSYNHLIYWIFEEMKLEKVVLASASPRRRELLKRVISSFECVAPVVDETPKAGLGSEEQVVYLASRKGEWAAERQKNSWIIAADTLVVLGDRLLGKPRDPEDAARMLSALNGRWHEVMTGLWVFDGKRVRTFCEITRVHMAFTDSEMQGYIATGEPLDKAGGYGIQQQGGLLVDRIDGDYYNVVGLPLYRLRYILKDMGMKVFPESGFETCP